MSGRGRELWHFIVHLRPHYQLLILPGGYLLGGLYAPRLHVESFVLAFFVVHLLLNGGVTAYNSYYDKDEGPIGGLLHPPKMSGWMLPASLALQIIGLLFCCPLGAAFCALYFSTMLLSLLYSGPHTRWKGRPLLSLLAVGVGTGTNTFLLGYIAAARTPPPPLVVLAALGVAALLLSLYPVSQVFQIAEDQRRGDRTFTAVYGLAGVRRFFLCAQGLGLALVSATLSAVRPLVGWSFLAVGLLGGAYAFATLRKLSGTPDEYRRVMRLKYGASMAFVVFIVTCLVLVTAPGHM